MIALGLLRDCTPAEVAGIVANFGGPGEVPLLGHHHGEPVGWLQSVAGYGTDVRFVVIVDDAAAAARLDRGPVGVSLEMTGRGVEHRPDERGIVMPVVLPSRYRGLVGPGYTLTAVAMLRDGDRPAGAGSAVWGARPVSGVPVTRTHATSEKAHTAALIAGVSEGSSPRG